MPPRLWGRLFLCIQMWRLKQPISSRVRGLRRCRALTKSPRRSGRCGGCGEVEGGRRGPAFHSSAVRVDGRMGLRGGLGGAQASEPLGLQAHRSVSSASCPTASPGAAGRPPDGRGRERDLVRVRARASSLLPDALVS